FCRLAALDRLDRGTLYVLRRVEIGLAGAQSDHVPAGSLERARLVRHRNGGGWLDALKLPGEKLHENLHLATDEFPNGPTRLLQPSSVSAHNDVSGRRPRKQGPGPAGSRLRRNERLNLPRARRFHESHPCTRMHAKAGHHVIAGRTPCRSPPTRSEISTSRA